MSLIQYTKLTINILCMTTLFMSAIFIPKYIDNIYMSDFWRISGVIAAVIVIINNRTWFKNNN